MVAYSKVATKEERGRLREREKISSLLMFDLIKGKSCYV